MHTVTRCTTRCWVVRDSDGLIVSHHSDLFRAAHEARELDRPPVRRRRAPSSPAIVPFAMSLVGAVA